MQRIRPVHQIKTELRADSWIDRVSPELDMHYNGLAAYISSRIQSLPGEWDSLLEELGYQVGDRYIARLLLPAFTEQFRDMTELEIDTMMSSFAFENCDQRLELEILIKGYTLKE